MPFGLNIAPRIFTKLTGSVVQELRQMGLQVMAYLDDWLVWAMTKQEGLQAAMKVMVFLESLGFQINLKNSGFFRPRRSSVWVWNGI